MMKSSLSIFFAIAFWAGTTASQTIGIFGDPAGTSCKIPVTPNGAGTAHIWFFPGGSAPQAQMFEFGMTGWPGWFSSVIVNPAANLLLGNPLSPSGCTISFQGCSGAIRLFTVSFLAPAAPPSDIELRIVALASQSCPRAFLCDAPNFTPVCVNGLRSWLNPSGWQAPTLLSPPDGAIDQPTSGVVLQWNWSVPPGETCTPTAY